MVLKNQHILRLGDALFANKGNDELVHHVVDDARVHIPALRGSNNALEPGGFGNSWGAVLNPTVHRPELFG